MNRFLALLPAATAACLLAGCASGRCCERPSAATAPMPVPTPSAAQAPQVTAPQMPAAGTILDHRADEAITFAQLVERLGGARVVHVGELHDQAAHHAFQAKVLAALAEKTDTPLALGLEMFFTPFQPALDAYVAGEIDEQTMLERTEWATRWGFGWEMYAPMLRLCREKKLPVIALNAPKEITRTVSRQGLDALTPEQKASLPPLDMTDGAHRAFVKAATGGHGHEMKPDAFERMYTAMVIWDETMSSNVAAWLEQAGPGSRMVVVAGNGHIADRYGVPARAARKSKAPYATIVQEVRRGQTERRSDTTYADFTVWWDESAPPKPPAPAKPAPKPDAKPAPDAPKPPSA
ncbi:MAG: ChaN family lipoprotein [Planctomycetia bacterium]|nr:ChaN family lipoprotein [Planctomycetia bacterium]